VLELSFCYGVAWEDSLQADADDLSPAGCYYSLAPPSGCGLHLNNGGALDRGPTQGVIHLCMGITDDEAARTMIVG